MYLLPGALRLLVSSVSIQHHLPFSHPQICSKSASALVSHDLVRTVTSCVWRATAQRDYLSHFVWFQLLLVTFVIASIFGTAVVPGREEASGWYPSVEEVARVVLVRRRHRGKLHSTPFNSV